MTESGVLLLTANDEPNGFADNSGFWIVDGTVSPVPDLPAYALIGRIGTNGIPFFIGSSFEEVIDESGTLYMTANDEANGFGDNSGFWVVNGTVHATPEPSLVILECVAIMVVAHRRRKRIL